MICEIARFVSTCPQLSDKAVNINYLGSESGSYCIENMANDLKVQQYTDGGRLCKEQFILAIRQDYSALKSINEAVIDKCREIEKWFDTQNSLGNLPVLEAGLVAVGCRIIRGFALTFAGNVDARYEAIIELQYYHQP